MRARVSEGLGLASAAKTAVAETYQTTNSMPADNAAAGLSTGITSKYVDSVSVTDGVITVTLNTTTVGGGITGTTNVVAFSPVVNTGAIDWVCNTTDTTLPPRYRTANCR